MRGMIPMEERVFLVLGGYGGAGFPTAGLLLRETGVRIVIAGRNGERAERAARALNAEFPGARASARAVDASDGPALVPAFEGVDMVVVCSATVRYAGQIARAALAAGADYLDIYYSQSTIPVLRDLAPSIRDAGRYYITQAGCHPGLPGVMVRRAANEFTHIRRAIVGMAVSVPYLGTTDSVAELMEELRDYRTDIFVDGTWRAGGYRDVRKVDFGHGFGVRSCYPMFLEEMRELPERCGIDQTGVYAAGFNWFVDLFVMPLGVVLGRMRRGLGARSLARLTNWAIGAFSRPPYGIVFKLEADGAKDGAGGIFEVIVRHEDGYVLTAIPTVACLLQYLDGTIARAGRSVLGDAGPGLYLMAHAVDPGRALQDMARMGAQISATALPSVTS